MNDALLMAGILILLVVAATMVDAYLRSQTHKPKTPNRSKLTKARLLGRDANTTSLLQDLLDERQRLKEANMQKETRI